MAKTKFKLPPVLDKARVYYPLVHYCLKPVHDTLVKHYYRPITKQDTPTHICQEQAQDKFQKQLELNKCFRA